VENDGIRACWGKKLEWGSECVCLWMMVRRIMTTTLPSFRLSFLVMEGEGFFFKHWIFFSFPPFLWRGKKVRNQVTRSLAFLWSPTFFSYKTQTVFPFAFPNVSTPYFSFLNRSLVCSILFFSDLRSSRETVLATQVLSTFLPSDYKSPLEYLAWLCRLFISLSSDGSLEQTFLL